MREPRNFSGYKTNKLFIEFRRPLSFRHKNRPRHLLVQNRLMVEYLVRHEERDVIDRLNIFNVSIIDSFTDSAHFVRNNRYCIFVKFDMA